MHGDPWETLYQLTNLRQIRILWNSVWDGFNRTTKGLSTEMPDLSRWPLLTSFEVANEIIGGLRLFPSLAVCTVDPAIPI